MFKHLIGQDKVKSRLGFYARCEKAGIIVPPIMLNAAKGLGKTAFAEAFHEEVKTADRKFVEINCGSIRNTESFFEQCFMPNIAGQERTILFDECHALPKDLTNVFLTAFNTGRVKQRQVSIGDGYATFDFTKQIYLFATTELHKMFAPLKDRLTSINFKQYTEKELASIITTKVDWVKYSPGVLDSVVNTLRGNARSATDMALAIGDWCQLERISTFDLKNWKEMKKKQDILPYGLVDVEVQILSALQKRGACSLQMLSAITGMSRQAIQLEAENNLLRKGFMDIDGKRKITTKGTQILKTITA